jgi:hypothetical protein
MAMNRIEKAGLTGVITVSIPILEKLAKIATHSQGYGNEFAVGAGLAGGIASWKDIGYSLAAFGAVNFEPVMDIAGTFFRDFINHDYGKMDSVDKLLTRGAWYAGSLAVPKIIKYIVNRRREQ